MRYIIKNGNIVSGKTTIKKDILIENEKIVDISDNLESRDCTIIDAIGKYIFPGFIDAHTHFDLDVSGTVTADDFSSGTKSALVGGTTTIIDFATQNKGETLLEALDNWHQKALGKCSCDYGFHMAISDWNITTNGQLKDMMFNGITSFKVYMTYDGMVLNDQEIFEIIKEVNKLGGIVGVHCENGLIIKELVKEQHEKGIFTPIGHSNSRPDDVEAEAVNRLLTIAKLADSPIMIVHLSSNKACEIVKNARKKGQKVLVETCPQYLVLDNSLYNDIQDGIKYIMSPPLRKKEDQISMWVAIRNDEIQTIATDHCSFLTSQKMLGKDDFIKVPNGIAGVQDRPQLIYTYGVEEKIISIEQMCSLLSEMPAKIYGLYPQKGSISIGSDADIVIWNPNENHLISEMEHFYNADFNPYNDMQVSGMAEQVFLRGKLVAENGKILKEKTGIFLKRKTGNYEF
ncbi:dihydropyrimidinase [Fusobacterium sp. PH5-44]|uniref:dihydropyrimidinase n=1 Tax=unclassified Fusobacterium TaxID=2648384 RepID=UPI003D2341A7